MKVDRSCWCRFYWALWQTREPAKCNSVCRVKSTDGDNHLVNSTFSWQNIPTGCQVLFRRRPSWQDSHPQTPSSSAPHHHPCPNCRRCPSPSTLHSVCSPGGAETENYLIFSSPSSFIPTLVSDWLTEWVMIHQFERSTRQCAHIWSDCLQLPYTSKLEVIWEQATE